ncbi:MAG TPA: hypothetical protein TECP_01376 [Hyphomicrobiaceae bacterium MAG_BT-2024]
MIFWIICTILIAITIFFVVRPLFHTKVVLPDRKDTEVAIYKNQLQEIEYDVERNLISYKEAELAKLEISRRLIASDDSYFAKPSLESNAMSCIGSHKYYVVVICAGISIFTSSIYLLLGTPGLKGKPYAERTNSELAKARITELIARVEARLQEKPDDPRGWDVIAPVYLSQEKYLKAMHAYRRAIQLNGENEQRLTKYAEATLGANGGNVSAAVANIYQRVIGLNPDHFNALFWLTVGHEQHDRFYQAIDGYNKILERQGLSLRMRQLVTERITVLRYKILVEQLDFKSNKVERLSQDVGKSISSSDFNEQKKHTLYMIKRLAKKLKRDGGDLFEWKRLIRAYHVLGQKQKAAEVYMDSLRAFHGKSRELATIRDLSAQLDINIQP